MRSFAEVQIVPRPHESLRAKVDRLFQQRVNEIMQRKELSALYPFFDSKKLTDELRRLQTAPNWHRHRIYYETWGCFKCDERERGHYMLGMCRRCYRRAVQRMDTITRRLDRNCERAEKFLEEEVAAYWCSRPKPKGLPAGRPKGKPTVLPGESGERIKRLRRVTGMSQEDLAAAASVDASTINHFERGKCRPLPANCEAIRNVLIERLVRAFWP